MASSGAFFYVERAVPSARLVLKALEQILNCALVSDDDGVVDEDT